MIHFVLHDAHDSVAVVVVEGVWPGSAFPEGMGINALTGADSPPPNGGAAFHDNAVWIRPA